MKISLYLHVMNLILNLSPWFRVKLYGRVFSAINSCVFIFTEFNWLRPLNYFQCQLLEINIIPTFWEFYKSIFFENLWQLIRYERTWNNLDVLLTLNSHNYIGRVWNKFKIMCRNRKTFKTSHKKLQSHSPQWQQIYANLCYHAFSFY